MNKFILPTNYTKGMNENKLRTMMDFIGETPMLSKEISSLSTQIFQKLLKQERIQVKDKRIVITDYLLEYDIKSLILNIVCCGVGKYKESVDMDFFLSGEEENEFVEDWYGIIMNSILESVVGVEA